MWALWWLVAFVCRTEQHATGNKSFYEGNKKVVNVFVNLNTRLVPAVADNMARFAVFLLVCLRAWRLLSKY